MLNGQTARVTNIGVIIIVIVSVIGIVILAGMKSEVPAEISMLLTSCIGFLVGTRFTPLGDYSEKRASDVNPRDQITVKEDTR